MLTQHPTLLIGPSDWDENRAPKAEFDRRIAALWDMFPQAQHAIVFGSASRHAELAYLTHFVPKLEPGIALLSRIGAHKLLFGGGPNMIGAMQPLTFITDMAPLGALGKLIADWTAPLLIGSGGMTAAMRNAISEATSSTTVNATAPVLDLMRRKSPAELSAIRAACGILKEAMAAIRVSVSKGLLTRTAVLAGERAAIDCGAQDVRTLFSLDGGRTLRPFEMLHDGQADPLQVYVAVRHANYWAEGFARFASHPDEAGELATALLGAALKTARAGMQIAELAEAIVAGSEPFHMHPVTAGSFANPIGLSLEPPPHVGAFAPGEVYSLRVGLTDGAEAHAIASALIAFRADGNEVLWRSGIA